MLSLRSKVDPGAMAIKGYFAFTSITGASPSDCLVSYPGHLLGESYSSAEMQSMNSAATADWAIRRQIIARVGFVSVKA